MFISKKKLETIERRLFDLENIVEELRDGLCSLSQDITNNAELDKTCSKAVEAQFAEFNNKLIELTEKITAAETGKKKKSAKK